MLTCKQFLSELSDYLDDTLDPKMKADLHRHVNECPNCWVVCNTTEKTIKIYKGGQLLPDRRCTPGAIDPRFRLPPSHAARLDPGFLIPSPGRPSATR